MKVKTKRASPSITEEYFKVNKFIKKRDLGNNKLFLNILNNDIDYKNNKYTIFSTPKVFKSEILFFKKSPSIKRERCNSNEKDGGITVIKKNLFKKEKKLKSNKSIVYQKKSINKNKEINSKMGKRNYSMNYFININTNLKNNEINSINSRSTNENEIIINTDIKPLINKVSNNMKITKKIIVNKKEDINKITYIQKIWKNIVNYNQKSLLNNYQQLINYLPSSFYFSQNNLTYRHSFTNKYSNTNISNNFNSIISYYNNNGCETINDYNNYNNNKFISPNLTKNNSFKSRNINLNKLSLNNYFFANKMNKINKSYKTLLNDKNDNSNTINIINNKIYNSNIVKTSSIKVKRHINDLHKKRRDSKVIIKNKLNKWIKNRMEYKFNPHKIDKYKSLIPNKNIFQITLIEKEKSLFSNNLSKDIVSKPNVLLMKKIKFERIISKNKILKEKIDNKIRINITGKINNTINKKMQAIIEHYYFDNKDKVEPPLNLENKLIMKKPFYKKKTNKK